MRRILGFGALSLVALLVSVGLRASSALAQPTSPAPTKNGSPNPGTEAALRFTLDALERGKSDLSKMAPALAAVARPQSAGILATIRSLGPIRSISFKDKAPSGADIYGVQFARGAMEWRISALDKNGKIESLEARREYPFKHLVDIGGRRLNMVCAGKGSPTIIFLQGLGGDMTNWDSVRGGVTAFAQTCFYDRAGVGYSDPSDKPPTAENAVSDLHLLFHASGIKGRVVLVGHSFGGLLATLYADKFLPEVAGLVLVDPSFSGQHAYDVDEKDRQTVIADGDQFSSLMSACVKLAEDRALSEQSSHGCFHAPRDVTLEGAEYISQQFYRPSYYAASLSEFYNFRPKDTGGGRFSDSVSGDQERRAERSFGNLPLVVLTGGRTFDGATMSNTGRIAMKNAWERGHDKLAQRSSRGESILFPEAHHFIQQEQPGRVVDAIRKVVAQARH